MKYVSDQGDTSAQDVFMPFVDSDPGSFFFRRLPGQHGRRQQKILPERERARIMDEWLKRRLENILLCSRGEQENDCAAGHDAR